MTKEANKRNSTSTITSSIATGLTVGVHVFNLLGIYKNTNNKYLRIGLSSAAFATVYGLISLQERIIHTFLCDAKNAKNEGYKRFFHSLSTNCFAATQALFTSAYVWHGASSSFASIISHLEVFYIMPPYFSILFYGLSFIDRGFKTLNYGLTFIPYVDDIYSKLFLSSIVFLFSYNAYHKSADKTIYINDIKSWATNSFLINMIGRKIGLNDGFSNFSTFCDDAIKYLNFLEFNGNICSCYSLCNAFMINILKAEDQCLYSLSRVVWSIFFYPDCSDIDKGKISEK